MKRSEINAIVQDALDFFARMNWKLPPFAHWSPEQWRQRGPESREIVAHQLGWDITDFGRGDYADYGLLLFTMRNGRPGAGGQKTYCEKIMIVAEGQKTPAHMHKQKAEDIINRGGGNLLIQVWNGEGDKGLADTPVTVSTDGVERTVKAGSILTLTPGESVTLPSRLQHEFWGEPGQGLVLVGEVSKVNDDTSDNYFHAPTGRFPQIEEDEAPRWLLVGDYPRFYRHF